VELEDRIVLATPEGVELQLVLAGIGSRFIAAVIDLFIQLLLLILAVVVTSSVVGGAAGKAIFYVALFAIYLYDVPFEVLASGRTPGKRLTHLRVIREGGAPVSLTASFIRNVLRFVDILPGAYIIGLVSILATKRNQRLGDLAAGTLVVRESASGGHAGQPAQQPRGEAEMDLLGWDVSAVTQEELVAVRRFLQRRATLDRLPRAELAHRLHRAMAAKVSGAPDGLSSERFLEALARAKTQR
jgi:uncharacterized RDD family membrane protein YckC